MTTHAEPIDIAGISCTLHIATMPTLDNVSYLVKYPDGMTEIHRGAMSQDDGTLRRAAITEAEGKLRTQHHQWEMTLV